MYHLPKQTHTNSDNRQTNKQTTKKLSLYVSLIMQVSRWHKKQPEITFLVYQILLQYNKTQQSWFIIIL